MISIEFRVRITFGDAHVGGYTFSEYFDVLNDARDFAAKELSTNSQCEQVEILEGAERVKRIVNTSKQCNRAAFNNQAARPLNELLDELTATSEDLGITTYRCGHHTTTPRHLEVAIEYAAYSRKLVDAHIRRHTVTI